MGDILGLMEESDEKKAEGKALEVRSETIIEKIKTREITSDEEYQNMAGFIKEVKLAIKGLNDYWDPDIKMARSATEGLRVKKANDVDPLKAADLIANQKMKVYHLAEEEKERKAESERLAAQARLQIEAEKKARAEQARKQAEEEAKAEAEGRDDVKTVEYETPVVPDIVPEIPHGAPKVAGISFAEHWIWECTDFSKVPDAYKKLDEVKINGYVRSMKGDSNIPGIRPYDDKTLRTKV